MTLCEELIAVLRHNPGPTIRVPRTLLIDALAACYGPAEEALATQRAECDADDQPWIDEAAPPLAIASERAMAAVVGPNDVDGAPLLRLGPGGDFARDIHAHDLSPPSTNPALRNSAARAGSEVRSKP